MNQIDEILAEALTAHGTRDLEFEQMLDVLKAGQTADLSLFSVDVTTVAQALPLPEWMFRLTDQEMETVSTDQIVPMALEFYRQNASDSELTGARFQVYFDRDD
jgi:hypothetical protein